MKITVIGPGRWGSFIAWYLNGLGHQITLYGRKGSENLERLVKDRRVAQVTLPEEIRLTSDLSSVNEAEIIVVSISSQGVRNLFSKLRKFSIENKTIVLCMKGIEIGTGKRLSEIAKEYAPKSKIAVWIGPGHVEEFTKGVPNCMVIDSEEKEITYKLVDTFSSPLIRFYYGNDLVGNEIGAAAKNVVGIAAGMLDGKGLSTLKGALMSRGTNEISRLIEKMGGNPCSAYGLCHLGDYEATVFSPYSHNRMFGESFIKGEKYEKSAEGYYTALALKELSEAYSVELPICNSVYKILYENENPNVVLEELFSRRLHTEF